MINNHKHGSRITQPGFRSPIISDRMFVSSGDMFMLSSRDQECHPCVSVFEVILSFFRVITILQHSFMAMPKDMPPVLHATK